MNVRISVLSAGAGGRGQGRSTAACPSAPRSAMRFDEAEYREKFLKKHRGARGAPGDLIAQVRDHAPGHGRGDRRAGQGGTRVLEQGLHRQGKLRPGGQAVPGRGRAAEGRARREDGNPCLVAGAAVRRAAGRGGVDRRHGRRPAAALRLARRRHLRHARPVRRQARPHARNKRTRPPHGPGSPSSTSVSLPATEPIGTFDALVKAHVRVRRAVGARAGAPGRGDVPPRRAVRVPRRPAQAAGRRRRGTRSARRRTSAASPRPRTRGARRSTSCARRCGDGVRPARRRAVSHGDDRQGLRVRVGRPRGGGAARRRA